MEFLIIFFMLVIFSIFFWRIDMWYLALLPISVFAFMLSHGIKNIFQGFNAKLLLEKWNLILIWLITMIGLSGILFFIQIQEIEVFMSLLILNIFLWILSYIIDYKDGKLIFEIGTRIMLFIILGTTLVHSGFFSLFEAFSLLNCLMLGIYAFLYFVLGNFYEKEDRRTYQIITFGFLAIGCSFFRHLYQAQRLSSLCFVALTFIFYGIYTVQNWEMPSKQNVKISVRRILAGERIFKRMNISQWKIALHEWFENSPKRFIKTFEYYNLGILIFLLCFFYIGILSNKDSELNLGLRYRLGIALFLLNTFLLKRINYASNLSRFSLSLIVNFIFYSIFLNSSSSIAGILPFLIVWGFLCQIILFYVDRINIKLFSIRDYKYWMFVTFIASICNAILLCYINLPTGFLVSLIFVYAGIELMLLYYIIQFLHELEDNIENAEKKEKQAIQELASTEISSNIE